MGAIKSCGRAFWLGYTMKCHARERGMGTAPPLGCTAADEAVDVCGISSEEWVLLSPAELLVHVVRWPVLPFPSLPNAISHHALLCFPLPCFGSLLPPTLYLNLVHVPILSLPNATLPCLPLPSSALLCFPLASFPCLNLVLVSISCLKPLISSALYHYLLPCVCFFPWFILVLFPCQNVSPSSLAWKSFHPLSNHLQYSILYASLLYLSPCLPYFTCSTLDLSLPHTFLCYSLLHFIGTFITFCSTHHPVSLFLCFSVFHDLLTG